MKIISLFSLFLLLFIDLTALLGTIHGFHTLYYNYWEVTLFLGAMDTKVRKKKKKKKEEENMNDIPVASIICWMSRSQGIMICG